MRLLLDPINDKHYIGDTRASLALATSLVTFDIAARRIVVNGKPDTVSFSMDYTPDELIQQMGLRAIDVLTRHFGWILFGTD